MPVKAINEQKIFHRSQQKGKKTIAGQVSKQQISSNNKKIKDYAVVLAAFIHGYVHHKQEMLPNVLDKCCGFCFLSENLRFSLAP